MHDSEVVASFVGDRSGGPTEAYDRYADPLYKYCLAVLGEPAEAADAVRDTFVIAAARLGDLREPDRLRAWLYAVARNECQRLGRPVFASAQAPYVMAGGANVDEDAERARLRDLLDAATKGLTPGEREVIELELRPGPCGRRGRVGRWRVTRPGKRARFPRPRAPRGLSRGGGRSPRRATRLPFAERDAGWLGRAAYRPAARAVAPAYRALCHLLHPARPGVASRAAVRPVARRGAGGRGGSQPAGRRGPPDVLRAHTVALAAGQDPDAIAHRAAVLGRVGTFDSHGFPTPEPGPETAPARGDGGGPARRRGRVAVAAGLVAAAVIGVIAVVLIDTSGHGKPAGGQLSDSAPTTGPSAAAPFEASPGTSPARSAIPKSTGSATTAPRATPAPANRATTPAASPSASLSATTNPTATATASATPTAAGRPGDAGRLPVGRRAAGTAGRHHDLADRPGRPGDLVEHRVQRARHGAPQPRRRNDQARARPLP